MPERFIYLLDQADYLPVAAFIREVCGNDAKHVFISDGIISGLIFGITREDHTTLRDNLTNDRKMGAQISIDAGRAMIHEGRIELYGTSSHILFDQSARNLAIQFLISCTPSNLQSSPTFV